jgi:phosphatidylglycerol---prolipoprotein diacylglyceryl transferase
MHAHDIILGPWPQVKLSSSIQLPTYYVVLSALLLGIVYFINRRSYQKQYSGTTAFDLFFTVMICGFIGARLFHVLFEQPQFYWQNPAWIFYFWQGGFVFYGGVVGGFLGGWLALKIKKQSFTGWLDFFTPVISLGYAVGRIACFYTGCCYGKVCDLPWAYGFRQQDLMTGLERTVYRHPTQLYAVVFELMLFFFILKLEKTKWAQAVSGRVFATWLAIHASTRFFIELLRDDDRGLTVGPLSLSMLLSLIFLAGAGVFLAQKKKP